MFETPTSLNPYTPNTVRLRDFLVKSGRGSKGRREAGEEKNYENNLLSSPASSASPAYPNRIAYTLTPLHPVSTDNPCA